MNFYPNFLKNIEILPNQRSSACYKLFIFWLERLLFETIIILNKKEFYFLQIVRSIPYVPLPFCAKNQRIGMMKGPFRHTENKTLFLRPCFLSSLVKIP